MRLAISFQGLQGGGGKAIGHGLLRSLQAREWAHSITAYVPEEPDYLETSGPINVVPIAATRGASHALSYGGFTKRLREDRQEGVLMLGNVGLVRPPCPQAVYIHNPWAVYPDSPAWRRCTLKDSLYRRMRNFYIGRGLAHASGVVAQTPVMGQRIARYFRVPAERVGYLPNCTTFEAGEGPSESPTSRKMVEAGHACRAICLARYYTHKNIEVLIDVAKELKRRRRTDVGIFVTVDPSHGASARRFMLDAAGAGIDDVLVNLGPIPMAQVASCYGVSHALLLPTFLESFTSTYLDAMRHGVPIITSDADFARYVCGEVAEYVAPQDAGRIADSLCRLADRPGDFTQRVREGKERFAAFDWDWPRFTERAVAMVEAIASGTPLSRFSMPYSAEAARTASPAGAATA
jgi:glycosyltransferase involved in cell wall biosynthesis